MQNNFFGDYFRANAQRIKQLVNAAIHPVQEELTQIQPIVPEVQQIYQDDESIYESAESSDDDYQTAEE